MLGEIEVLRFPPLTWVVPVDDVYQIIVSPVGTDALKVTVPAPQRVFELAVVGSAGESYT
jgi:hypothetical protein